MAVKDSATAYILWLGCCFGFFGLHRFYLDSPILGIIYFCTAGLCGIGQLIDLVLIPMMVEECNKREKGTQQVVVQTTTVQQQPQYVQPQPYVQQGYVQAPPMQQPQYVQAPPMQQGYYPPQGYVAPPMEAYQQPPMQQPPMQVTVTTTEQKTF